MAQKVTVQEAPQEQLPQQLQPQEAPQQAAPQQPQEQPQQAANPLLEVFKILLERFKTSKYGFEFSIEFTPPVLMTFEEFEELTKGFDSVNYITLGGATFADLISIIDKWQVEPSRCKRAQKRISITLRSNDNKTLLIDYAHGRRETVPAKCS